MTVFAPHITSPQGAVNFNQGRVSISWTTGETPSTDENVLAETTVYDLEYTDNYIGDESNWYTINSRIPWSIKSYTWNVGKMIKSNTVRIRMRSKTFYDESVSDWTMSDTFAINVFKLTAPAIVSPVANVLYSDYIMIVLDETLTSNTFHQKVRYTLEYASESREIDWTMIVANLTVGQNVVRWNLEDVPSGEDYVLRLTVRNSSTCTDESVPEPDQITRSFVHNVKIQQAGMFLIDTMPPEAIIEIDNSIGVTSQLEQIINVFAEDDTTSIKEVRLRECDAGSVLALGNLEDPYDPLGGCTSLVDVASDFSKFGKSVGFSPKTQWVFSDQSGLKKIEALLTDVGGNSSLQEQVKVFLSVFSADETINDFAIVVEQRDQFTIDDSTSPPTVTTEPSIFEVVYLSTSSGDLWILEPFARFLYNIGAGIEVLRIVEYNDAVFLLAYEESTDKGYVYQNNSIEPLLLQSFTNSSNSGRAAPIATAEFDSTLYIGFENGELWSYNGTSFSSLDLPTTASIKTLYGDRVYLYIGFENSSALLLYNGSSFVTLNLET